MLPFSHIVDAISTELIRAVTGKLFTEDQIKTITSHAVGKYFAEYLPKPTEERAARERVEEARHHISEASRIITHMQAELGQQTEQLDKLIREVEEKKKLAERYETLAKTNQEQFAAFRVEMESALRQELITQSEKGKRLRRFASSFLWFVTLVLGAALGTYFKEVIAWLRTIGV